MKKYYFSNKEEAVEVIRSFANSKDFSWCNKVSMRISAKEFPKNIVIDFIEYDYEDEEIISYEPVVVDDDYRSKVACAIAYLLTCDLDDPYVTKETYIFQESGEDATINISYSLCKYKKASLHIEEDPSGQEASIRKCVGTIKHMTVFEVAKYFANKTINI